MVLFKAYLQLSVDSILRRTFTVILRCNFCCGLFIFISKIWQPSLYMAEQNKYDKENHD